MEPLGGRRKNPENVIRDNILAMLTRYQWIAKTTHGNIYQAGFPDIYCTHRVHGIRWVEVKLPDMKGSRWTKDQLIWFPKFADNGTGIWILTAATEAEYKKLFEPPNLTYYLLATM